MSLDSMLDGLIRREGTKYTDIPGDAGGPTKYGITIPTLEQFRARKCTAKDIENLTEDEARMVYELLYIEKPGFNRIQSPELKELLVDCGVNHGQGRAVRWLQEAVGAKVDGDLGRTTSTLANTMPARVVFAKVLCTRLRFYEVLDDQPSQVKFSKGWTNRCCEFVMVLASM